MTTASTKILTKILSTIDSRKNIIFLAIRALLDTLEKEN